MVFERKFSGLCGMMWMPLASTRAHTFWKGRRPSSVTFESMRSKKPGSQMLHSFMMPNTALAPVEDRM
jgi:hypothetical protein